MEKRAFVILATPFYLDKGSSVRARSNILALSKVFDEVVVFTYPVGNDFNAEKVKITRVKSLFYKRKAAGPSFGKVIIDMHLIFSAFTHLWKNKDRYSYVIGEDIEGGIIAKVLSGIFRKPYVYEMYNPFYNTLLPYPKWKIFLPIVKLIDKWLESSKCMSVEWDYELERVKNGKNICSVVYDAFPEDREDLDFILPEKYMCYSGNFKKYQGIEWFLNIYSQTESDYKVVLVGETSQEIKNIISELKLNEKIITPGSLSLQKTNTVIGNSCFCILPRIIDGPPGMKALHYFSQGKAVLATDLSCNKKMIIRNKTGYLCSTDTAGIINGLKIMQDTVFIKEMEDNIRKLGIGSQNLTDRNMLEFFTMVENNA